jgi:osmoprotectant transport system permease protein
MKGQRARGIWEGLGNGAAPFVISAVLALLAHPEFATLAWRLFGGRTLETFPTDRLLILAGSHAELVLLAIIPASIVGIGLGVLVTRPAGAGLRPLTDTLVAAWQAVPPVVVVALAFPSLGFGAAPTVLALILYGVMPILRSTVAALESTPPDARAAAGAIGLTPGQIFREVEWPTAFPVVLEGVRIALVLAVATAAVGALAGATTLGTPIVIGLQNQNELYVLQGAAATAALAFLAEGVLISTAPSRRCEHGARDGTHR